MKSKTTEKQNSKKITTRGRELVGSIISTNSTNTAKIEFERVIQLPKYERYEKRRTRLIVHNPEDIKAKIGDKVRIMECRPISKTKNFIIIEVLK